MGLKDRIIKKLEADVEYNAGHIDLSSLDEEKRNKLIEQFGEGDINLTKFLKTAFENNILSVFCCSGHGKRSAYVTLQVTEENLELLRRIGKVLSNYGVFTNFTDDYIRSKIVTFRSKMIDTKWLNLASEIMKNPEMYDDSNPSIYYHENFVKSYKPFGFDLKKKLLSFLRKDQKLISEKTVKTSNVNKKSSWELSEDDEKDIDAKEAVAKAEHNSQITITNEENVK